MGTESQLEHEVVQESAGGSGRRQQLPGRIGPEDWHSSTELLEELSELSEEELDELLSELSEEELLEELSEEGLDELLSRLSEEELLWSGELWLEE